MNLDKMIAVRNNKTIYRDADRCLKVFEPDYSKTAVFQEALNQTRMEQIGLPVPKVLGITSINGKWTILSEYIKGKTMAQLLEKYPEKKKEFLQEFVTLQSTVHEKICPDLGKMKDKINRKITKTSLSATLRYDLHVRLETMPNHTQVCHGDFNPSNILLTRDGTPYILDWAHVTQGNAAADAACTYLLFWLNSDTDTAQEYLHLFCQESHTPLHSIQEWIPIVAAARSVDGNAVQRAFLRTWLDVADNENDAGAVR
ncbi:MAG: phosphotransferase [Eubacteriales bacterium]|nr:phosphotransferase [Eubacteriales bacterium]